MTQITELMSVLRPSMMLGLATETMVVSIRIMKKPITRDQSAGHGRATFSMGSLGLKGGLMRAG